MTHLTITLDEDTLERARSKALREGTSVDVLLRSYLEAYSSSQEDREQAVRKLLELLPQSDQRKRGTPLDARGAA